jgi:hypothetical protein
MSVRESDTLVTVLEFLFDAIDTVARLPTPSI